MRLFFRAPDTFYPLAHSTETFRCYDGSEGQIIHHDGLLAKVLRVRGVRPESGWGVGTQPYHAVSMAELRTTLKLRASR